MEKFTCIGAAVTWRHYHDPHPAQVGQITAGRESLHDINKSEKRTRKGEFFRRPVFYTKW